jgi:hypothetical protein
MKPDSLQVGVRVRVARRPVPVAQDRQRFPETFDLFQKAIGRAYQVRAIDEHGHAELWLRDDGDEDIGGGAHSIYIEPEFLEIA